METDAEIIALEAEINRAETTGDFARADDLHKLLRQKTTPSAGMIARHGRVAFMLGDKARAATITRRAVRADPTVMEIQLQLADIYFNQERKTDAVDVYRKVLEIDPDNVVALRRLSQLIQIDPASHAEALSMLKRASELAPEDAAVWLQMGAVYAVNPKTYADAEAAFQKALKFAPNTPSALHNLGLLRRFQGDLDKAEEYLTQACAKYPTETDFAFSLGGCYYFKEDLENALKWYRRAIEIDPNNNAAKVYEGYTLLLMGDWEAGWRSYEARRNLKILEDVNFQRPQWDGGDLKGETLLINCEQGMGDNLQFIRYAPLAAARGCRVVVMTHKSLSRLFKSLKGVSMVVEGLPEPKYFYRYISVMSLPLIFETRPDTVPAEVPYMRAPDDLIAQWRERLASYAGLKVGLCWRGNPKHVNDRFRSASLKIVSRLLDIPGITFFSMHKDLAEHEKVLPEGMVDLGSRFGDYADTAAAVESLDLVISVDTSVCHLVGAVGRPVWTMIARGPDFRWGLKTENSPWYPSMKLYRQDTLGDWEPVIDRMAADLKVLAAKS